MKPMNINNKINEIVKAINTYKTGYDSMYKFCKSEMIELKFEFIHGLYRRIKTTTNFYTADENCYFRVYNSVNDFVDAYKNALNNGYKFIFDPNETPDGECVLDSYGNGIIDDYCYHIKNCYANSNDIKFVWTPMHYIAEHIPNKFNALKMYLIVLTRNEYTRQENIIDLSRWCYEQIGNDPEFMVYVSNIKEFPYYCQ